MTGKRYSRQRELIYNCLRASKEHPTAEMIYNWLKPRNPTLSLGTVYRNLNLLAEEGIIIRMPFPVERYDADTSRHAHFRCGVCGGVFDLEGLGYDSRLDHAAAARSGHRVERHELLFSGVCKCCGEKEGKALLFSQPCDKVRHAE